MAAGIVACMVMPFGPDDPDRPQPGWRQFAVDVEIERVSWKGEPRFQWLLYHEARLIKTGLRRSHWGAQLAGLVAAWWWYQRNL